MDGTGTQAGETAADAPKLRVFLSYSRKDSEFTGRLAEALTARGYLADFDRSTHDKDNVTTGISAEDDWWKRLQEMIEAADAMVFVVSPDSAASKVCDEEIAYARSLGKRVIPVLRREIDFASAPPRLAALNVKIRMADDGPAFEAGVGELSTALDRDVVWLREQTRLVLAAADWERSGKREDELLRGAEISEAEAWSARRPASAPEVPEAVLLFLAESRKAQGEREENERRVLARQKVQQRWIGGLTAAALVVTLLGAWFVMQGQRQLARRMSAAIAQEAGGAYDQGRYDRALRLAVLASHDTWLSPAASEAGFEIGKAMAASRLEARFPGIRSVDCLSVNADGTLVLAVADDAPRLLARDDRGEWAEQDLPGRDDKYTKCAAFAPDGKSFVTTGIGDVMLWTREGAGWKPRKLDKGKDEPLEAPVLLASGRLVAAMQSTIVVWTPDGKGGWARVFLEDKQTAADTKDSLNYVRASADGRRLLSVSSAAIHLWTEAQDGSWSEQLLSRPGSAIPFAVLSTDGKRIVLKSGTDIRILVEDDAGNWFGEAGDTIKVGLDYTFSGIEVSPDGKFILTNGMESTKLWAGMRDDAHFSRVTVGGLEGLAIEPFSAGSSAFMTSDEAHVKVWTLGSLDADEWAGVSGPVEVTGEERVFDQAISADGHTLATAGFPEPLEIWRLDGAANTGAALTPPNAISYASKTVAYSPSSKRLATDDVQGEIVVWEQGDKGRTVEVVASDSGPSFAVMPDENTLVVNGDGLIVYSRDKQAKWGEGVWSAEPVDDYRGDWASVSSDGRRIVAPYDTLGAKVWTRGADGKWSSVKLEDGDYDLIGNASVSADGSAIVSIENNDLLVWRQDASGAWKARPIENVPYFGIDSVAFGAGGAFVSAGANGVLLWTPKADGTWAFERVSGTEFPTDRAELSRSGRSIVTASRGAPARVWTRREDGKWVSAMLAGGAKADGAALAPDGHEVVLLLEGGPTVFDASWLAPGGDPRATRRAGSELAKRACETKLGGAGAGGVRKLSVKDAEAAPIIGGRAGEDVCAWKPAWYDGVLGALFGWLG